MTTEEIVRLVREVMSDFVREENQGLLQRDFHKAEQALAGEYACERVLRAIEAREKIRLVDPNRISRAR